MRIYMPAFLRGLRSQRTGDENRACRETKMVIVGIYIYIVEILGVLKSVCEKSVGEKCVGEKSV